jgi:hypothetical protein
MYTVTQDSTKGTIIISDSFSISETGDLAPPSFNNIDDEYIVTFTDLNGVEKFSTFAYDYTGKTSDRYLTTQYRISRDFKKWTEWYDLPLNIKEFPPVNSSDTMYFDLKFIRKGSSTIGTIKLLDYTLNGSIVRNLETGGTIQLSTTNEEVILKPPYIYKVFRINDIEILYRGGELTDVDIKYRFSQDYGRTTTEWEYFTKENITSVRINPVRFFQIEYLINYKGNTNFKIYDINLIGDFQNVSLDYQKTNLYGVREDCNCLKLGIVNDTSNGFQLPTGGIQEGLTPSPTTNVLPQLSSDQIGNLFKPYQLQQATDLLDKLSNDANQMFGHEVVYFLTDPDRKGTDYSFHEYQLYNYVCDGLVKVSVENNQFPENTGAINQFDLTLFDSFEIHIPKKAFKQIFGVDKRPSKEDFLWFCEINRMFTVEHSQAFRSFNNNAIYYKLMLKKYTQKANVIGVNQTITDKVKELTKNSTIDELFGLENIQDKKAVANKEQFKPLTKDKLRLEIGARITKELIENAEIVISKSNYDLSSVPFGATSSTDAVVYRNTKDYFKKSDNISYMCWFNVNNYTTNDTYYLFDYYDDINDLGFRITINNDLITTKLNGVDYSLTMGQEGTQTGLNEEIWYGYILNVDQRQRKISQYVYKRNTDDEDLGSRLSTTILKKVNSNELDLVPVEFELENISAKLLGCDMKITNIRLFIDVIPLDQHSKMLNQSVVRDDSKYLIFADNANQRLVLPSFDINQIKP